MILASGVNDTAVAATVFSAVVGKDYDSDTVQFEVDTNGILFAIVSGELVVFDITEQDFEKVTVAHLGDNSIEALFKSGAYVRVKAENGFISFLQVVLPESLSGQVQGLLGTFNGDTSDDLLPQFGEAPLPPDSSVEDIQNKFGVTWIVDSARKSLFVYEPEKNWDTFYDPYFIPSYQPTFGSPELESQAKTVCGDDRFCLFDIATTGNVDVGVATLETSKEIEEIYTFLLPVVCSPPCEFGACVANDSCRCSEGYTGKSCSEAVVLTCEDSICENGGTCTRHVNDHTCECPPGFSGFLCEEGESAEETSSNTAVAVGVSLTMIALVALIISAVIVTLIVLKIKVRQKKYEPDRTHLEMSKSTKEP
jgi:deleted-in-malignant-brain-tumors protein 1